MKRHLHIGTLLCLFSLVPAISGQTVSKPSNQADQRELIQFRAFIASHPVALAELKKDPSQIASKDFAARHRRVGQYIREHPAVVQAVKSNPRFFDDINGTDKHGGQK
jgi:hypothetical protein